MCVVQFAIFIKKEYAILNDTNLHECLDFENHFASLVLSVSFTGKNAVIMILNLFAPSSYAPSSPGF